ncbi:hypothetical protein CVT24_008079 [Panaeolus cyanescens]|uniref:RNA helicase n=1 Tax=Panaeolus cyanescens TaxID=181874 RepID=A0A409W0I5_9AGAR|nr:hypothetical protein CVT24_008079 [Panaeolus cyanescens]
MPPKKKKTQLKPVARGFATVSVPKKFIQEPIPQPAPIETAEPVQKNADFENGPKGESSKQASLPITSEEQLAAGLVNRLQEKVEKETIRMLKSIEVERRFAKTLPRFELDPQLRLNVLKLIAEDDTPTIEESGDKALLKLAVTYGVLRRLGYPEDTVLECLKNSQSADLEHALEWLYITLPEEDIDPVAQSPKHGSPESAQGKGENEPGNVVPREQARRTDSDSPTGVSHITPTAIILEDESDGSDEDSDPTSTYASLRIKREEPSIAGNPALALKIQKKLQLLEKDPIFDQRAALARYQQLKVAQDRRLQHERLYKSSSDNIPPPSPCLTPPSGSHISEPVSTTLDSQEIRPSSPLSDTGSDTSSAEGVFGGLETAMAKELTVKGVTYQMKDMSLPKNWSGPTPKRLLSDLVLKANRYATITYNIASGHSRAIRASVTISWRVQNRSVSKWLMVDVACPEVAQAEQYVALLAFHELTYPPTAGFAQVFQVSSTSFRLLPPVYRELWDEMEVKRTENNLQHNMGVWATLLYVSNQRDGASMQKPLSKNVKPSKGLPVGQSPKYNTSDDWNVARSLFLARKTTPEYEDRLRQRSTLPISHYREDILKALEESQVLVLSGETGCGKSTQLPSFILEHCLSSGTPCKILCTEPRRISAISLAKRVSYELCDPPNSVGTSNSMVGYSIRLENNMSRTTRLAYVTNGIALRMFEGDSALDEFTHIIVDEVHERGVDSDFLLIVLKTLLRTNQRIKIVLMSATVDADKISSYFDNCPTFFVPGRTYPVETLFLEDAIEYTNWSIPDNSPYLKRRQDKYSQNKSRQDWSEDMMLADEDDDDESSSFTAKTLEKRYSAKTVSTMNNLDDRLMPYDLIVQLLETIHLDQSRFSKFSRAVLIFLPGLEEIRTLNELLVKHPGFGSEAFKIYPLHSTLTSESQGAVFDIPPSGVSKIVIATNIAETGITIPDITCMPANPLPEMLRLSLATLGLRIKVMKLKLGTSIEDVLSKALDPPSSVNIQRAVSSLVEASGHFVKALTTSEDLTPMGRLLSKLPTDVHLGKFLLAATFLGCLDPALTIAATLNSKSPFVNPLGLEHEAGQAKASFRVEGFNCGISSGRYSRNQVRFVNVPQETNSYAANACIVNAALTAGLYPKVLYVEPKSGALKTITNNQQTYFHPSSVNFGRNATDFGTRFLNYFTLMHSKKLYAWETGPVEELCLILLCGEADTKLVSNILFLDKKVQFQVDPKTHVALRRLRSKLLQAFDARCGMKALSPELQSWTEVGLLALSGEKITDSV